jgi:hypothetical protein
MIYSVGQNLYKFVSRLEEIFEIDIGILLSGTGKITIDGFWHPVGWTLVKL